PGDTLVSVRAPVGDLNMAMERCCVGRSVAAVRHRSSSRSYTYYSMQHLQEDFARFEAEGTVFGSINKTNFESLKVLIPNNPLAEAFQNTVGANDQSIEVNTNQSAALAALRDALLPRLLSGEVRASDAARFTTEGSVSWRHIQSQHRASNRAPWAR
ncbi:MAG: restriction endonuclease subunit S, partial [Planctomycetales bacterium]